VQKQPGPPSLINTTENLSTSFTNAVACKQAPPVQKSIMKNVDMENQANNSIFKFRFLDGKPTTVVRLAGNILETSANTE